ncbi:two-partner secretion domain-containing protein [Ketobacter alkanivorans]|uniref:Filamentous haemagglutinin FhaB/tRNA nuclease CdiA-like TPS domain-containing protein n=1 Tax=Ketobacter alkanivorans TaxID=1917421 RepID=A0A2K9LFK2_9GAMM|nr:filamentous hemagglutinin N-terminal domain-containing protein [Ketobacter alkanivorans]AUM10951.1 hypothetical protein Kalk_00185 [Ketobacter alkanivorans]
MPNTTKLSCSLMVPILTMAYANAAPQGGSVISGSATIGIDGADPSRTIINQTSQNTAIDWNSFNIANGETVSFVQPNVDAIALNRDFSGSPSQIFGNLDANGNVFILNTAGVLVGSGASIDVGGLLVSDLMVSDSDARNFATTAGAQNWSLPFSDEDLDAGGIEILGTINSHDRNGINVMGQYIYIEGTVRSGSAGVDPGGPIHFLAAGTAVLVTDPSGLYGVEASYPVTRLLPGHDLLFEIPDTASDASVIALNNDVIMEVVYEAGLPIDPGHPELQRPGISYDSSSVSTIASLGQTAGRPISISTAVNLPSPPVAETIDNVENTISDALTEEPEETESTLLADNESSTAGSLDNIMQSCQPKDRSDKDCIKQNAIKRYLGKLLIGGSLPD